MTEINRGIQRAYGRLWEKLRAKPLARDFHRCQPCKRNGRIKLATEVDQLTPKAQGGAETLENAQSICTRVTEQRLPERPHKHRDARSDGAGASASTFIRWMTDRGAGQTTQAVDARTDAGQRISQLARFR